MGIFSRLGTLIKSNLNDLISKANANFSITPLTPYNVTYDGKAHTATGSATGVGGVNLSGNLNLTGTTHTNAGAYGSDNWTFIDPAGNYSSASGTIADTIAKANANIAITQYSVAK